MRGVVKVNEYFKVFDAEGFVKNLKNDVFHDEFINKLGRTLAFSKLRCGGEYRLTGEEWSVIERGFRNRGVPMVLSTSESVELAHALSARAVTSAHF